MSIAEIGSVMETADVKIVFNKIKNDPTSAAKAYKQISSNYKPKSIAALARDQIMTFPIYMSGDIPAEAGVTIIKALEKQYSVFAMLALSNHLNYDSTKYNSIGDVISEIHSNEDHPNLLNYVVNLGDNISNFIKMTDPSVRESMLPQTVVMSADELAALDYNLRDEITTESLNDYYQPNHHNIEKTEAALEGIFNRDNTKAQYNAMLQYAQGMQTSDIGSRGYSRFAKEVDAEGRPTGRYREVSKGIQMMEPNKYFGDYAGALTPTIVTSTITVDNQPRDFMIAIKGTAHVIPSELMHSTLADAVHNNELAFKIIKWSKGELKFFRDLIFSISESRNDAISMKNGNAWLPALKRRKLASKAFVGGGAPVSPISTLVIADTDVEYVKANTGIDIYRPVVARKLIKDYFLLGIMIFDTQNQTIMTMLDADVNPGWANTTLAGLKSSNAKGSNGKLEMDTNQVLKMLGRY